MFKRIKNVLISLALLGGTIAPAGATIAVHAQTQVEEGLCAGSQLSVTADCTTVNDGSAATKVDTLLTTVINIFSIVVGVVSVIMIIVGGLKYITSGGDPGNVTGAKNTILYAVIGLVVVALAQIIVKFVLGKVNQATAA